MSDAPNADPLRWLLQLRELLAPALELLNAQRTTLLPTARGETAARLRRLLTPAVAPGLAALLRDAAAAPDPVFLRLDGLRIAVLTVPREHGEPQTIVLGERLDAGRDASRRAELARIGRWLARAISRPPASASDDPVRDWHQMSVLHRALGKAVASGSTAAVIHAYVEAVAIWVDVDTRAYAGDRSGRYTLSVSLAGASGRAGPRSIPGDVLSTVTGATRLDPTARERLGFAPGASVVLVPVPLSGDAPGPAFVPPVSHVPGVVRLPDRPAEAWLLVYVGDDAALRHDRLAVFHDLLVSALRSASEVEASRLTWAMTERLLGDRGSPREAAVGAIAELEQAGLCSAALLVLRRSGSILLELGTPVPRTPDGHAWPEPAVQRIRLAVPEPFAASLTIWRPADRPFTEREARLGAVGASVLASWISAVLSRGDLTATGAIPSEDRRRQTASRGLESSLLVVWPGEAHATARERDVWVREIRRRLRLADVAGSLPSGEIGVLLPATGADAAHAVAGRLRQLFREHAALGPLAGAALGIATGRAGAAGGHAGLDGAGPNTDDNPPAH
ncbi:MAG: hypothetical protein AB7O32_09105 [Vicinamibacterales bacterium]